MNDEIYELKEKEVEKAKVNGEHESWFGEHNNGLFLGVVFILVGLGFLLSRFTNFHFDNWWALFIFIPALISLSRAWQGYQANGRLSEADGGALMGGLFMLLIASIFLFGLSWSIMWPFVLIIIGVGTLVKGSLC